MVGGFMKKFIFTILISCLSQNSLGQTSPEIQKEIIQLFVTANNVIEEIKNAPDVWTRTYVSEVSERGTSSSLGLSANNRSRLDGIYSSNSSYAAYVSTPEYYEFFAIRDFYSSSLEEITVKCLNVQKWRDVSLRRYQIAPSSRPELMKEAFAYISSRKSANISMDEDMFYFRVVSKLQNFRRLIMLLKTKILQYSTTVKADSAFLNFASIQAENLYLTLSKTKAYMQHVTIGQEMNYRHNSFIGAIKQCVHPTVVTDVISTQYYLF
jgi:hypothetical protein